MALAGGGVPHLDSIVIAATGNLLAIWTEGNTVDRPIQRSIVSKHHTFENTQESETAVTYLECPLNVESHFPVPEFQSLISLSKLPLAIVVPSGLHATDRTLRLR